jgi:DNA repair exonuclease SbcCD ATPase subunit
VLEAVRLTNFQRHERVVFKFDPHVTTIVGDTDTGKSSLLRALVWAMYNTPSGEEFLRHGADGVEVALRVDGRLIKRARGTANTYSLDGKPFKAFGTDVPPEIAELLRVTDMNVQAQHDAPFWFSTGKAEVSRQLNQIVNLGIIDESLHRAALHIRHSRERVDVSRERLVAAKVRRDEAAVAVVMDKELAFVEQLEDRVEQYLQQIEDLSQWVDRAAKCVHELLVQKTLAEALAGVVVLGEAAEKLARRHAQLEEAVAGCSARRQAAATAAADYEALHEQYHKATAGAACPLCLGKGHL